MKIAKALVFLLLGVMMNNRPLLAQTKSKACEDINVKVEVVEVQSGSNILTIVFQQKSNYNIQLLNSRGEIKILKDLTIRDLEIGEYDLIITDSASSNRCPYYKRIKIEGQ
jgi:hypothetical protein